VIAIGVLLLSLLRSVYAATPRTLVAPVERVSDGDTIVAVSDNGTKVRIRLLSIDGPEVARGATQSKTW